MFFLLKYGVGIRVPCSGRLSYINPDCFISKLLISHCPLETIVYNIPFVSRGNKWKPIIMKTRGKTNSLIVTINFSRLDLSYIEKLTPFMRGAIL